MEKILDPQKVVESQGEGGDETALRNDDVQIEVVFEESLGENADGIAVPEVQCDLAGQVGAGHQPEVRVFGAQSLEVRPDAVGVARMEERVQGHDDQIVMSLY